VLILRCIAGRVVLTLQGQSSRVQGELTLGQARALQAELGELIATLELGEEQPGTLPGLIEQIGRVSMS
jgi:hypothetical protein